MIHWLVATLLLAGSLDSEEPPVVACPSAEVAPQVDGRLEEPLWLAAARIPRLIRPDGEAPTQRTEVLLAHGPEALYVGFICEGQGGTPAPPGGPARRGEWVQVWIAGGGESEQLYLFTLNPAGVRSDARRTQPGTIDHRWQGEWQGAAAPHADGWSAEFVLPFATLGIAPASPPPRLRCNFAHHTSPAPQRLTWALVDMGECLMLTPEEPVLRLQYAPLPFFGEGWWDFEVRPPGEERLELSLHTEVESLAYGNRGRRLALATLAGGRSGGVRAGYFVEHGGLNRLRVEVTRPGGKTLWRSILPFRLPDLRPRIEALEARLQVLAAAGEPVRAEFKEEVARLRAAWWNPTTLTPEKVEDLCRRLAQLEATVLGTTTKNPEAQRALPGSRAVNDRRQPSPNRRT